MKVAALVSGGVDSSVALRLMKDAGHEITAFYLKVWLEDELEYLGQCPWEEDLEYVHAVCDELDIPVRVLPMQQDYRERVIRHAIEEVHRGRTPNPDILCNSRIKFGCFYERMDAEFAGEFEKVATGHYARVREARQNGSGPRFHLATAPDPVKDQTYFLAHLSQAQLSRAMFPIGEFRKGEVRDLAAKYALANQNRRDSQGLCFLGKISFRDFIKHHLGERPGDIIELESGAKRGEHRGFWFHTIGQRQGLGLSGGPWYVVRKDVERNIVYISRNYFSEDKQRDQLIVGEAHWPGRETPPAFREVNGGALQVKLRHGAAYYNCSVHPANCGANLAGSESSTGDQYRIRLEGRDQGIAAGQYAVFYRVPEGYEAQPHADATVDQPHSDLPADSECLGCAVIQGDVPVPA